MMDEEQTAFWAAIGERMNRPPNDSYPGKQTAVIVTVCCTVAFLGCLAWLSMAGIFIYFGADRVADEVLLNNTGQALTINWEGKAHDLPSGISLELPPGRTWVFTIQTEKGEKWNYQLAPIDQRNFFLQIEADGSIYLLRVKPQQPSQNLPLQPNGYPLRPQ